MPDVKEYHTLNKDTFEDLITDLYNAKENTNTYSRLGRSGQKQDGIDIISDQKKTVIQCKYRDDIQSDRDIRNALMRDLESDVHAASLSELAFEHFIMVSTFRHDAELQRYTIELRNENDYPFYISYMGWDELRKWVLQFPDIQQRYFAKLLALPLVELVNIDVVSEVCSWHREVGDEFIFYNHLSTKSQFPVFDFVFINHSVQTIVLKTIN